MTYSKTLVGLGSILMLLGAVTLVSAVTGASSAPADGVTFAAMVWMIGVGYGLYRHWRLAAQILWITTIILPVGVLIRDLPEGGGFSSAVLLFAILAALSVLVWFGRKHLVAATGHSE